MGARNCVIGVDVGTSGCKVIAVAADGELLADCTCGYPLYQPQPGWTEQEPEDWWTAAAEGLRAVTARLSGHEIAGVSFSGQMHGMVALDKAGAVVRRAILWNDQRTQAQCDAITAAAGGPEALLRATNNRMLTGYTGGKLLWMKENEPDHYAQTCLVINPKDYIRYRLTGLAQTEVSDASGTGLFHVKNRDWAWDVIDAVGFDRALFPQVLESTGFAGAVTQTASAETGLPAGVPCYAGGGDAVISTTGLGLCLPGRVGVTLGTSGVVAMGLPGYADNPQGVLQLFCSNAPGGYMAFGCTLSAAGSYQWFRDALGGEERAAAKLAGTSAYALLDELAGASAAGAGGVLFLPYLSGERCPVFDAKARGAFLGLHATVSKGDMARAVLEGVAMSMRHVYDCIRQASPAVCSDEIAVAGGGAYSPLWRQILADVFGLPVRTVYGSEHGGAFGAALVAGAGCGLWAGLQAAMALARPKDETLPDAANRAVYEVRYATYTRLYDALKWSF